MTRNLPAEQTSSTALIELPKPEADETALRYIGRLMEQLPAQTEDVINRIAENILSAEDFDSENELWESTGSNKVIGKSFRFDSVHPNPSDFADSPLPFYLVCKVVDMESGEESILTTGSVNICVSLVKAQLLGRLPAVADIVGPKRTPRSGHVPLHLRWHMAPAPVAAREEVIDA